MTELTAEAPKVEEVKTVPSKSKRLISLDVFRGITIIAMILVNNAGNWSYVYWPLEHSEWNGWTPTDLIFPFFLFIVGVAMTFSFSKFKQNNIPKSEIYKKVFRRTVVIFILGIFLNTFPFFKTNPFEWIDLSSFRILGVLQRIAIAYFFSSIIFMEFEIKVQVVFAFALLILYWIIMMIIPVPGFGAGNLTVGGNLAGYIDRIILGSHLYTKNFDPEGLLSTIPAVSSVLFGMLTGHLLHSKKSKEEKANYMFVLGNAGLVLGIIIGIWFPINKQLWTSSYVIFTTGFALVFLAACYWLIDIKGYTWWTKPFLVYGMNAITVYVLSSALAKFLYIIGAKAAINNKFLAPLFSDPYHASISYPILQIFFWLGVMWIFYKKKIFIKV